MMLRLAFLLALLPTPACAQATGAGSPDPYFINEGQIPLAAAPSRDVSAKTRSTNTVNPVAKNCGIIGVGQSNSPGTNTGPTAVTPANLTSIDFLDPYDGQLYQAKDPIVGGSAVNNPPPAGGAALTRVADSLRSLARCDYVVIVALGIDNTTVGDWATGNSSTRLGAAIARIQQRGLIANFSWRILWGQGENDTTAGTLQAAYQSSFGTLKAQASGFTSIWVVAQESYNGTTTSAGVRAAQAAVVDSSTVYAGPDADALTGNVCNGVSACRQGDGLHFSDNGNIELSTGTNGWVAKLHATGAPF